MTRYEWIPIQTTGTRRVRHVVQEWKGVTSKSPRFEPWCGTLEPRDVVVEGGQEKCLECYRKLLGP